jgi:hypothetical protein
MSAAYLICIGDPAPADPAGVPGVIAALIDEGNAEALRLGWAGTTFGQFSSCDGYLQFSMVPGDAPATIDDLRRYREEQRAKRLEAETQAAAQPEQGSMFS